MNSQAVGLHNTLDKLEQCAELQMENITRELNGNGEGSDHSGRYSKLMNRAYTLAQNTAAQVINGVEPMRADLDLQMKMSLV